MPAVALAVCTPSAICPSKIQGRLPGMHEALSRIVKVYDSEPTTDRTQVLQRASSCELRQARIRNTILRHTISIFMHDATKRYKRPWRLDVYILLFSLPVES